MLHSERSAHSHVILCACFWGSGTSHIFCKASIPCMPRYLRKKYSLVALSSLASDSYGTWANFFNFSKLIYIMVCTFLVGLLWGQFGVFKMFSMGLHKILLLIQFSSHHNFTPYVSESYLAVSDECFSWITSAYGLQRKSFFLFWTDLRGIHWELFSNLFF